MTGFVKALFSTAVGSFATLLRLRVKIEVTTVCDEIFSKNKSALMSNPFLSVPVFFF
jgi:hypothetical protein